MRACNEQPPDGHPLRSWGVACHMAAGHDGPHAWDMEPSSARRGLDRLLAVFRHREVEAVDSQPGAELHARVVYDEGHEEIESLGQTIPGPWVLVRFVGGDEFAIWKRTGAVYRVGLDGAVDDDPILTIES